jgi:hypothetical protein
MVTPRTSRDQQPGDSSLLTFALARPRSKLRGAAALTMCTLPHPPLPLRLPSRPGRRLRPRALAPPTSVPPPTSSPRLIPAPAARSALCARRPPAPAPAGRCQRAPPRCSCRAPAAYVLRPGLSHCTKCLPLTLAPPSRPVPVAHARSDTSVWQTRLRACHTRVRAPQVGGRRQEGRM